MVLPSFDRDRTNNRIEMACVVVQHAHGHSEIGVIETNANRQVAPFFFAKLWVFDTVQSFSGGNRTTPFRWMFDLPGDSSIEASSKKMCLGLIAIDIVPFFPQILVIAKAKPNQDLVSQDQAP